MSNVTYGDVAYHPSGLAIGFAVTNGHHAEIWMSTNQGQNAERLVEAPAGTTFAHLVFARDGKTLLYSVDRTRPSSARRRRRSSSTWISSTMPACRLVGVSWPRSGRRCWSFRRSGRPAPIPI